MNDRDEWLARTFVDIADTLVSEFDLFEYLARLTEYCADFLGDADVGVMFGDDHERLQLMASSSERMRAVELFELQNSEGPCLDCVANGQAVINVALGEGVPHSWPAFEAEALNAGCQVVHAVPLRLRSQVLGALNVFGRHRDRLEAADARVLQAMADAATIGLLQERARRRAEEVATDLRSALDSRVVIEQAKGVLAERLALGMDEAFELLRSYARRNSILLADTAEAVVTGHLTVESLRGSQS
ncbi:MAG TPA: GAF and ANTAR domain-containing protein [Acidimicrobiia bacterium]|nr:GAF and ANTAR domain-containing protein [Acidimicrobiia bacterium]